MNRKVLVLMGPTGVGKSKCAIKLAKRFNMEIISADSVQVFKEFNIGSAKIAEAEMEGVIHYGIDFCSPKSEFTANDFVCYAKEKIEEISLRNKIPLIVGGTGLYIKALIEGYNFGGTEKKTKFREEMEEFASINGLDALYKILKEKSPDLAEKTDRKNKQRIIRALEIATFGNAKSKQDDENDYHILALNMPRAELYNRINLRCEKMLKDGLVEEVRNLYKTYGDCQPMRAIGYKEVLPYLKGEITDKELLEILSQHTRNYAKRQLTFLRSMEKIEYFDISEKNIMKKIEENVNIWLHKR